MDALIQANGLGKRYDDFHLEGIDIRVEAGTVVGLIGSNGAGKTTTIKMLLGILLPDEGDAWVLGCPVGDGSASEGELKQRVGVVLDTCAFPDTSKVKDVATLGRFAYRNWDAHRFAALCERFELVPKKNVKELSRGMGMKLMLAFALSHDPELLILDEATAGLDPMARDEVLDILREFMAAEGHAILLSTHITSDLEKIADEIVCIDGGRLVFDVPKDEICDLAGVAHCRERDLDLIGKSAWADDGRVRKLKSGMTYDVLVPDRFAFAKAFSDIALDSASIDDYMTLTLKGEQL